jgi:hypothetical protein
MFYAYSFLSMSAIALLLIGCLVALKICYARQGLKKICSDRLVMLTTFDSMNSTIGNEQADGSSGHHDQDDEHAQNIINNFVYIHNRLLMASFDELQYPAISRKISSLNYVVVPFAQSHIAKFSLEENVGNGLYENFFNPPNADDIYKFDLMACALEEKSPTQKIVFLSGQDQQAQAMLAFLLGCHMMLSHGLGFEETYLAFRRLHGLLDPQSHDGPQISVKTCLRAFCRAKCSDWIVFKDLAAASSESSFSIHILKYLHYARSRTHAQTGDRGTDRDDVELHWRSDAETQTHSV